MIEQVNSVQLTSVVQVKNNRPEPSSGIEKPYKIFPPYPTIPVDYKRQLEHLGLMVDEWA